MRMALSSCRVRTYSGLFVGSVRGRHAIPRLHLVLGERANFYWDPKCEWWVLPLEDEE